MSLSLIQRIYWFTLSCCLLFIVLITSILWSSQKMELAYSRESYAQKVENYTNSLRQLFISDNIYSENYKVKDWLVLHEKLTNMLELSPVLSPQQQTIQNSINSQNKNIKQLLKQLKNSKLKNASAAIKNHLKLRLMTQLEAIQADSGELSAIAHEDIRDVMKQEVLFILCIFTICISILLFGAFNLTKIFTISLKDVKKAFAKNHSGNFQEIQLSQPSAEFDSIVEAFNSMNKKLSDTTVSLEVMKKIVEERTQVLEQLSNTDPLTQVANRRALFERGNMEFARALRSQNKLALILLDCDFFKNFNDEFGHLVGDELLKHICKICYQEIRDIDFLARYGGEEFIIILPDCDVNDGIEIAKRIQTSLASHCVAIEDKEVCMTLSIGVCMYNNNHKNFDQLINDADQAMYLAKKNGRNRIEVSKNTLLH